MSHPVTYYCPHCETVVAIEREGYLADKTVTPYPLDEWEYADPTEAFEEADGVRFCCGESDGVEWQGEGCGETFYLSFVRFENGEEVDPRAPSEHVALNLGRSPAQPRGPEGPPGPGR